jgi:hypothetical protein
LGIRVYMIFFRDSIFLVTRLLFIVKCFQGNLHSNFFILKLQVWTLSYLNCSLSFHWKLLWLVTNFASLHFSGGTDQLYFMMFCIYALSELLVTWFLHNSASCVCARACTLAAPWSNSLPGTGLGTSIGARVICQLKLPWSLYGSWDVLASNKWPHYVWCVRGDISLCVMC